MRTPRHRRTQAPRRLRKERVAPYSPETHEALAAFIGELAAMPPDVLLLFQSILKGESLRKIAESRSQNETATRTGTPPCFFQIATGAKPGPTAARYCQTDAATPGSRDRACLLPNGKSHNRQW